MYRRFTVALALIAAALAIAAQPVSAATSSPSSTSTPSAPSTNVPPFAVGTLAAVSGSTLSVQGANGATTVAVTDTTTYQQMKSADVSAIAVGDCARIIGTGSLTKGITAFSVALTPATSDGCTRGGLFGGARANGANGTGNGTGTGTGRTRPRFGNGQRPAGAPTGNGFGGANGTVASGTITSVSGDHVTAKATTFVAPKKKNGKPTTTTKNVKVTVSSATTVTQTVAATLGDLSVGSCVTAAGTPGNTGTLTAVNVTISQPQNGSCSRGFGGAFGAGGGAGGGSGSASPQI